MSCAAVGAKTARACDYCIRRRARWYCAADDAFLCQACDGSVHSANALARRHERVRLNTASPNRSPCIPSWHRGPHRRARTPRHGKYPANTHPQATVNVPEIGRSSSSNTTTTSREDEYDETDQLQLLYRVPVLDPLVVELCSSSAGESKYTEMMTHDNSPQEGFLPLNLDLDLDIDMEDFAADMESFLGEGIEGESYRMDDLGLLVKAEEEEETLPFALSFDYISPASCEEETEDVKNITAKVAKDEKREWRMSLRLDYEAISAAWASQGSPWMNGQRPQISPNDCWFHSTMGSSTTLWPMGGQPGNGDGGREARVSRYREKRRTRLFSKKIRYEVRKLNAEKRPRMKGRFVKRSSNVELIQRHDRTLLDKKGKISCQIEITSFSLLTTQKISAQSYPLTS
ncbi:hypothetical protein V2J09_003500 [Rumex salicifolius]